MAVFDTTRPLATVTSGAGFTKLFTQTVGTLAAWNDARQTRAALNKLTSRELEDIGLIRGDIDMIGRS